LQNLSKEEDTAPFQFHPSGTTRENFVEMSHQCVPSWELDDNPTTAPKVSLRSHSNSGAPYMPM